MEGERKEGGEWAEIVGMVGEKDKRSGWEMRGGR